MSTDLDARAAEAIRLPMVEVVDPRDRVYLSARLVHYAVCVHAAAAGFDDCSLYLASLSGQASRSATHQAKKRRAR